MCYFKEKMLNLMAATFLKKVVMMQQKAGKVSYEKEKVDGKFADD